MAVLFNNLLAMSRKPYYATANVFQNVMDLSWIPSVNQLTTDPPQETADGNQITFTFADPPRMVILDGQWRFENVGYLRTGNVIAFIDHNSVPFAPAEGADIRGVL